MCHLFVYDVLSILSKPVGGASFPVYRFRYTEKHDKWILERYESYAAENQGMRIPKMQLIKGFHKRFPGPSLAYMIKSVDYHINQIARLSEKRNQYPRSDSNEMPAYETLL
jgi:hypothetical protein